MTSDFAKSSEVICHHFHECFWTYDCLNSKMSNFENFENFKEHLS